MEKYFFLKRDALRPTEEQRLLTKPFYQNANTIYARFDEWKDIDKFYFIPLYLEMTYCINGIVAEMAPDPVWLGSFVRCTLEHPDLFQYKCPNCSQTVLPYRYVGSPLSGVVHLEGRCDCGWKGFEPVSGWHIRATALRDQIEGDKFRHTKCRLLHPGFKIATINELIDYLKKDKEE